MFGDRVRAGLVQLAAVDHTDADVSLSDLDVSHLLIEQPLGQGFLRIGFKLRERDECPRTHVAGWLRVGGINFPLCHQHSGDTRGGGKSQQKVFHMNLVIDFEIDFQARSLTAFS